MTLSWNIYFGTPPYIRDGLDREAQQQKAAKEWRESKHLDWSPHGTQSLTPGVKEYVDFCKDGMPTIEGLQKQLSQWKKQQRKAMSGKNNEKSTYKQSAQNRKYDIKVAKGQIARIQAQIKQLKEEPNKLPMLRPIDFDNVLRDAKPGYVFHNPSISLVLKIGENAVAIRVPLRAENSATLAIINCKPKGLRIGEKVVFLNAFEVLEVKPTVIVIRPLNLSEWLETPIPEGVKVIRAEGNSNNQALINDAEKDDRSQWRNETYDQIIYHVQGGKWAQLDSKTQKISAHLTETGRTPDWVELSGFNFGIGRILSNRLEMKKGDKWEWVSNGHWIEKGQ